MDLLIFMYAYNLTTTVFLLVVAVVAKDGYRAILNHIQTHCSLHVQFSLHSNNFSSHSWGGGEDTFGIELKSGDIFLKMWQEPFWGRKWAPVIPFLINPLILCHIFEKCKARAK